GHLTQQAPVVHLRQRTVDARGGLAAHAVGNLVDGEVRIHDVVRAERPVEVRRLVRLLRPACVRVAAGVQVSVVAFGPPPARLEVGRHDPVAHPKRLTREVCGDPFAQSADTADTLMTHDAAGPHEGMPAIEDVHVRAAHVRSDHREHQAARRWIRHIIAAAGDAPHVLENKIPSSDHALSPHCGAPTSSWTSTVPVLPGRDPLTPALVTVSKYIYLVKDPMPP